MDNKKRRIVGVAVISGVILVSVATVGVTKLVNEKNAIEAKTYVTADASNYASSNKVVTVNLNKNNGTGGTDKVRIKKETDATSPEGEYKIYEIDSHGSEFLVTPDDIGGGTHKLEVPTLERYYFKGYYYQDKKIINEDGFISGKYSDSEIQKALEQIVVKSTDTPSESENKGLLEAKWEKVYDSWDISENSDGSINATLSEDGTLKITGTGKMKNYSNQEAPWHSRSELITALNIQSGITNIGNYAFKDLTKLQSVNIPETVTEIGSYAFQYCTTLKNIELEEGLISIGDYAFGNCKKLKNIDIPMSVTTIGNYVFDNDSADIIIYGYKDSQAETYAEENNMNFVAKEITALPLLVEEDNQIGTVYLGTDWNLYLNFDYSTGSCSSKMTPTENNVVPPTLEDKEFLGYTLGEDGELVINENGYVIDNIKEKLKEAKDKTLVALWNTTTTATIQPGGNIVRGEEGKAVDIISKITRPQITYNYNYDGAKDKIVNAEILTDREQWVVENGSRGSIEFIYKMGYLINVWYTFSSRNVTIYPAFCISSEVPTRDGYTFKGWYTQSEGGEKVESTQKIEEDTTVYAQWEKSATQDEIGITLNKTSSTIKVGGTENLIATITPENATNKNVTWESSNTAVATVSESGVVTGKSEGTATITATTEDGNKTATCEITVKNEITDEKGPTISSVKGETDSNGNYRVVIKVTDESGISKVLVNGQEITTKDEDGNYYFVPTKNGEYKIEAYDTAGNKTEYVYVEENISEDNNNNNSSNNGGNSTNNGTNTNNSKNNTTNSGTTGKTGNTVTSSTALTNLPKAGTKMGAFFATIASGITAIFAWFKQKRENNN